MKIDKNKVNSILFITLSNLGDIILSTPVLEKLYDEFPGAAIDVITGSPGREIFSAHEGVRNVTFHPRGASLKKRLAYIAEIRKMKYDLVVDLKNSLVPYLSGARYRTSVLGASSRRRHKIGEHLSKLSRLEIDTFSGNRFFLPISDEDVSGAERILSLGKEKRTVVINPGAKSHLKRWGAEKFAKLADKLSEELDCLVLICGNEDDRDVVGEVLSRAEKEHINLCCKTSIGMLSELMRRSDLVITNDSAPLHVASAVNAPTIAIFGPSDESKYGPLSEKNRILKPDVSCRPCGKALCAVGPDEGCIGRGNVNEVFEAAKELLG